MSEYSDRVELPDGDEELFETEEDLENYKEWVARDFDRYCQEIWEQMYGDDD